MKAATEKYLFFIGMAISLLTGEILRFYNLPSVPPGIWYDEAFYADKAMSFLNGNAQLVYNMRNETQLGLFPALLAAGFAVLGDTITAPRAVMAVFGCLALAGCALLTYELLKDSKYKRQITIIATFLLATSYWHLNFSRLIFSASLVPAFEVFSLYLTLMAFRYGSAKTAICAGVVTALGFYTYWQYYPFAFIPAGMALFYLISDTAKYKKQFLLYAVAFGVTAAPLAYIFYCHDFTGRLEPLAISPSFSNFWHNTVLHIKMLFLDGEGDRNWRHNLSGQAQLSPLAGFGVIAACGHFIFLMISRKRAGVEFKVLALLLLWCMLAMLPASLSNEGLPHASRAIGMVIALQILAAMGIFITLRILYAVLLKILPPKLALYGLGAMLLAALIWQAVATTDQYFNIFANNPKAKKSFRPVDPIFLRYNFVLEALYGGI